MTRVITYGTYDLLHAGHIRLLERAKSLGDYLIVGVTSDDFDKARGKINVQQSLMERIEAVRATGIADEIIIEEYEGQKIDDIKRYNIDIFTVGTDWVGKFDYLNEYCKVVYLERTEGVSSSEIRAEKWNLKLGLVGETPVIKKYIRESEFVNGLEVAGIYTKNKELVGDKLFLAKDYDELLELVDAVYLASLPQMHYQQIKQALEKGKHVLCESPIALSAAESRELFEIARERNCVLMDGLKTAYAMAYSRLLLLAKGGKIGDIYSVDATCTSLKPMREGSWNSICGWGPTAMLPVFHVFGTAYQSKMIASHLDQNGYDLFTKISFQYPHSVASVKVGKGVKSEGELVISGTKGHLHVPAPGWSTDSVEVRFEDQSQNKRYFYQLDGEGIRYELLAFAKTIETGKAISYVDQNISDAICQVIEDFCNRVDFVEI